MIDSFARVRLRRCPSPMGRREGSHSSFAALPSGPSQPPCRRCQDAEEDPDFWQPGPNWVQCDQYDTEELETTETREFVGTGWFTEDYQRWLYPLLDDLGRFGHDHDFKCVTLPPEGLWEEKTLVKAREISKAMDRNPGKWIINLDVDCRVLKPLDALVDDLRADVGFYLSAKYRRRGGAKVRVRSGTMIFAPTFEARSFVHMWETESGRAPRGENDQTSLQVAMGRPTGASLQSIPNEYCATPGECEDLVVLHDSASRKTSKVSNLRKYWWILTGKH